MGRRKIEIKPIKDERNRSVTFLKRKAGLFKKAHELSVLCSVDIGVVICGLNKKVFEYSSTQMSDILDQHSVHGSTCEHKGPNDFRDKDDEDEDDESFEREETPESLKTPSHKSHSRQSSRQLQTSGAATKSSPYVVDLDRLYPKALDSRTRVRVEESQLPQRVHPAAQHDTQLKRSHGHTVSQSGIVDGLALMSHSVELAEEGSAFQSGDYHIMPNYPLNSQGWPVMQQQNQYQSSSDSVHVNHPSAYNPQNTSYNRQDSGRQSAPPFTGPLNNESHAPNDVQYASIPPATEGHVVPNNDTKYHSMFTPVNSRSSALAAHFTGLRPDLLTDVARSRSSNDLPMVKGQRTSLDQGSLPSASSASDTTAKRPKLKVKIPGDKDSDGSFTGSASHRGTGDQNGDSAVLDSRLDRDSSSSAPNSAVHLPPPSPLNAYPSGAPSGALNHFATTALRPEQTPISALPSRFAGDLLPSPSSFYPEWSASFGRGADAMLPSPLTFQNSVVGSVLPSGTRDFGGGESSKRTVAEDRSTRKSENEVKRQKV